MLNMVKSGTGVYDLETFFANNVLRITQKLFFYAKYC